MTPTELRAAIAGFWRTLDDEGHGIQVTLRDGRTIMGDYYGPDDRKSNPSPDTFRVDPYAPGTLEPGAPTMIRLSDIAALAYVRFHPLRIGPPVKAALPAPRFTIDGTDQYGIYCADGRRAPYAVHDAERQDWIAARLRWHWQARAIKWLAERGLYAHG